MLGTTLRERDDTYPVLPASKARVTQEERFDFGFCGAPQPSKIRLVKTLVRAGEIAISAFTTGHLSRT